jgi:hypothetical protein
MADSPKKLVTWKQWVLAVAAAAVGASMSLYQEHRDTGAVAPSSIFSVVVFLMVLGIIAAVFWYANQPESEVKQ